jgi:hypothetical protein
MKYMGRVLANLFLLIATVAAAALGMIILMAIRTGVDVQPVWFIVMIECAFVALLGASYFIGELTR